MSDLSIRRLNTLLAQNPLLEDSLDNSDSIAKRPIIFVMGLPRSGTTPLVQLLVQKFKLGYVTNLVARFWEAPEIGIALAKEISNDPGGGDSRLQSFYGFTSGYEGHHEFGYFWQRWFKFKETHYLDTKEQLEVDVTALQRQLLLMEKVWKRPLIFKNAAALPLQTEFLGRTFENSLFIHIERDLIDIAASLLKGRKKYLDDINEWFSIKPKEYLLLKNQSVYEQIAGQVYYANEELLQQLKSIPRHRKLHLTYDKLCNKTAFELKKIKQFFNNNQLSVKERDIDLKKLAIRKVAVHKKKFTIKNIINKFQTGKK